MDFYVRIWEGSEVRTRYYRSEFVGHAAAEAMISMFETNKSKLNTGSCGLHILHSAFKFGVNASGRNIDEFLRNMHWLLEDTPDCREYYRISVETKPLMPLQFCKGIR